MTFNPGDEVKIVNIGNPYEPVYAQIVLDEGNTVRVKRPEPCCSDEIMLIDVPKALVISIEEDKKMTVNDAMREIRKIKDAIETLDRYNNGEMGNIAEQHIDEIRQVLEHYMDQIAKQVIKDKVRIIIDITPNENGTVTHHIEVEPWEPFQMKCPYKD